MQQALWHDTIFDALGAAVQAAGGVKKVAGKLWPSLDPTSATARLRGALNPDHAQKLCPAELLMLAKLARDVGDNSLMEFLARELGYEVRALEPEEAKKRAKRVRRLALLEELKRLEDEE
jgi:hypothetical protein